MPKKTVGLVADGEADVLSLKRRFSEFCHVYKSDGPRGHTVDSTRLCHSANKQIEMLKDRGCSTILVVTDFEGRTEDYWTFVDALCRELAAIHSDCLVSAVVPNQMMENWLLADISHLSRVKTYIRKRLKQKNYEGTHGKRELRDCFVPERSYLETRDGPELFVAIRLPEARKWSPSLDHFLRQLEAEQVAC